VVEVGVVAAVVVIGLLVPATMYILWILLSIGICFHGQLPRSYVYYVSILPYFHCHDDIPHHQIPPNVTVPVVTCYKIKCPRCMMSSGEATCSVVIVADNRWDKVCNLGEIHNDNVDLIRWFPVIFNPVHNFPSALFR
jgi:hypothetical protein